MTAKYELVKEEDEYFDNDYICFDQDTWNRVPNQKTVIVYLGIRPANDPDFYKFEPCDCSQDDTKGIHEHKYDPDVIDHIINQIFDRTGKVVE